MHSTSMENMARCYNRFIAGPFMESRESVSILDVGGTNVNGSYKDFFDAPNVRFLAADIAAGPGVDLVLDDPYTIPVPDGEFDIVISGQVFEHCEFFWLAFQEMVRVLKPDGVIILIAPSTGPIHRYPVDCYRFYPDAYAALAKYAGCRLEACIHDQRGPWQDLAGVFRKASAPPAENVPGELPPEKLKLVLGVPADPANTRIPSGTEDEEKTAGAIPYLRTLAQVHERLQPDRYLEIGIRKGGSLALAKCQSIGIDPAFDVATPPPHAKLFRLTSDDFFERIGRKAIDRPIDLAFIDGMHLFEYALRDFMNVERLMSPYGVIVVDDIFPNHPVQGSRFRKSHVWTGDVWRLMIALAKVRPDLLLLPLNTAPTGLLLIANVNPSDRLLWDRYNPTVRECLTKYPEPPASLYDRSIAQSPDTPILQELLSRLRDFRRGAVPAGRVAQFCRKIREEVAFQF